MANPLKRFLLKQVYLTVAVYVLGYIAFNYLFPSSYDPFFIYLPVIFYVLTGVFHGSLLRASRLPVKKFSSRFLAIFGAKIMVYLLFIIVFSYFNPQIAVPFLVSFLILYLAYTIFEIVILLRYLREKNS